MSDGDFDAGGFGAYTPPETPRGVPGAGHNAAPLAELMAEDTAAIRKRRDELLAAFERVPKTLDTEAVAKVTDLAGMMRKCVNATKLIFQQHKAPIVQAGREVDDHFRAIRQPLEEKADDLDRRLTLWKREQDRLLAAAYQQAQEAAIAAQAPPPEPPVVRPRGELGTVGTIRKVWKYEVTGKVPLEPLRKVITPERLDDLIKRFIADGGRKLKNVRIWQEEEVRAR